MNRNELKEKIDKAKFAYYNTDTPIISDKEYDELIKKYGSEPYVGAPVLKSIQKINIIDKPMLSLDKVHNEKEIITFSKGYDIIASVKCDGLSVRLIYQDGKLISANTRGNGIEGADITEHVKYFLNVPLTISKKEKYIIDGEAIIYNKDFQIINQNHQFKNNRNTASGALSLLDMNIVEQRRLSFIAWDVIKGGCSLQYYHYNMEEAELYGFTIVPMFALDCTKIEKDEIKNINQSLLEIANIQGIPCDGIVWRINDLQEGNKRGQTAHHFLNAIAWKPHDELYETKVKDIEWTMGRTGQLTPVLIYNDIDINGTICNRASLHNISIMTKLMGGAYPGQKVFIYKSNEIIPQVDSAQTDNPNHIPMIEIPKICPYCGKPTVIKKDNDSEFLYCTNLNCNGKLINRLNYFVGKKGLDIKGLSKATLEKLISWEWLNSITDIFKLSTYKKDWINKSGFGEVSVTKILNAIEEAKYCTADKYICALGIPLIGKVASTALIKTFNSYNNFRKAIKNKEDELYEIDGIGEIMINNLLEYDYSEADFIFNNFIIEKNINNDINNILKNKTFVITGSLKIFKNRDEIKKYIESYGGKVTNSVSSKTTYLINNDTSSGSSKNLTAIELKIPIINEEEFLTLTTADNKNEPNYLSS